MLNLVLRRLPVIRAVPYGLQLTARILKKLRLRRTCPLIHVQLAMLLGARAS